jgi:hypothetical protein
MGEDSKLQVQGDVAKALKDFDVKLPGDAVTETSVETTVGVP